MTEDAGATSSGDTGTTPTLRSSLARAERMQSLLSRAVDEQITEQRQVATALTEVRGQIARLGDDVRALGGSTRLDRLQSDVAGVATALRTGLAALGDRVDELARRVEASAGGGRTGAQEVVAARLADLAGEMADSSDTLETMRAAVESLAAIPHGLADLQSLVVRVQERVAPLAEVRDTVQTLVERTADLPAVRDDVRAVAGWVEAGGGREDVRATGREVAASVEAVRREVTALAALRAGLDAVSARLEPLARTTEVTALREQLDEAEEAWLRAATVPEALDGLGRRLVAVDERLQALEGSLGTVGGRVQGLPDAVGGLGARLAGVEGAVAEVAEVRRLLAEVAGGVAAAARSEDLQGLRSAVDVLHARVPESPPVLDTDELAGAVTDLVAPEVTTSVTEAVTAAVTRAVVRDVTASVTASVTERVTAEVTRSVTDAVVEAVTASVTSSVTASVTDAVVARLAGDLDARTRASEERLTAHVDEAVLALAEALLRRRRTVRAGDPLEDTGTFPAVPAAAAAGSGGADEPGGLPVAVAPAAEPALPADPEPLVAGARTAGGEQGEVVPGEPARAEEGTAGYGDAAAAEDARPGADLEAASLPEGTGEDVAVGRAPVSGPGAHPAGTEEAPGRGDGLPGLPGEDSGGAGALDDAAAGTDGSRGDEPALEDAAGSAAAADLDTALGDLRSDDAPVDDDGDAVPEDDADDGVPDLLGDVQAVRTDEAVAVDPAGPDAVPADAEDPADAADEEAELRAEALRPLAGVELAGPEDDDAVDLDADPERTDEPGSTAGLAPGPGSGADTGPGTDPVGLPAAGHDGRAGDAHGHGWTAGGDAPDRSSPASEPEPEPDARPRRPWWRPGG